MHDLGELERRDDHKAKCTQSLTRMSLDEMYPLSNRTIEVGYVKTFHPTRQRQQVIFIRNRHTNTHTEGERAYLFWVHNDELTWFI